MQKTWNLLVCPGLLLLWQQSLTPSPLRVGQGGTILTSTKLNDVFHVNWVPVCMKEQKVRWGAEHPRNCMVWLISCKCMLIACRPGLANDWRIKAQVCGTDLVWWFVCKNLAYKFYKFWWHPISGKFKEIIDFVKGIVAETLLVWEEFECTLVYEDWVPYHCCYHF